MSSSGAPLHGTTATVVGRMIVAPDDHRHQTTRIRRLESCWMRGNDERLWHYNFKQDADIFKH